ncbi:hypothetical protein R7V41_01540 [Mesomycoplasma ovipneumoniae]|uniref:Uncharacterized protein n=1 Tax=Mesomycoplasma ovipneumoniae TaxID=29562 RepID=A0AAJ2PAG0_9BACT|nr:hypothetical protein [Mesomycoplasma ovipneumoniae]MDW2906177.1 hypothetical protein [Mesomycoplasma ovipneumoniae]MDW2914202.1 hypothetical protein [Mesomycoplasma ovipneumoniae]
MKKKLKFFKFITNILAFTSLTLSVFGPLWHFQNTKSYSDFKLETRDIDLSNSKKPVNFDDLIQIVSAKNQENLLVINANIKNTQTRLNKTSTNSDSPNLDDIQIQINQEGEVILNSASLELVNKKAELYFEEGVPKLKLEGYVFDFRELKNQTRVEKTIFQFLLPFIPFIAKVAAATLVALAVSTPAAPAVGAFPNVAGVGTWYGGGSSYYPSVGYSPVYPSVGYSPVYPSVGYSPVPAPANNNPITSPADNNPITQRTESSIVVDLDKLPKAKGEPSIKSIANTKALELSIVKAKDKEKLVKYTGIHPAWFFNFHSEELEPYFVISEQAIPEPAAWFLAVGSLLAQSELTKIIIKNLLPSSIKDKMDKEDHKIMDKKLNSPIDFYSYNEPVMKSLAEKTKYTANLIVGNRWSRDPNNNLNKDIGFTKDHFVVGEGLASDAIDWADPKNEFDIDKSKDENIPSYVKIYFPSYHVRRARMIKGKFAKREFIPRKKMLNMEKVHFLYGMPKKFNIQGKTTVN